MDREISKEERMRSRRKSIIKVGITVLVVAGVIVWLLVGARKSVNPATLTFSLAESGPLETMVSASGSVKPAFEEIITSPVASRIMEVYRHPGDSVKAGTPLLRLDLQSTETDYNKMLDELEMKRHSLRQTELSTQTELSNLEMQIKVKEMTVNRLKVEVENERRLDSLGSGTGDNVRKAELAYNTGLLELKQLRHQLSNARQTGDASVQMKQLEISLYGKNLAEMQRTLTDARILAPHDGTLAFISNEIGSPVGAGERVAVISDLSHFRAEGEIAEGNSERVSVGARVLLRIGTDKIPGQVTNITPRSERGMVSFTVRLDNDSHPRLRSGLRVEIFIVYGFKNNVTRIANGSYFKGPGDYMMFVETESGDLERRKLRLGDSNNDYVEVERGLSVGERVVVSDMEKYQGSKKLHVKK